RKIELNAFIDSLCQDLQEQSVTVTFSAENPVILACRPNSLKRALVNVIQNAAKYGERAEVKLRETDTDVFIEVTDIGPGIPPSQWERVFEPFVRLETSRNIATGGIGLGLSITRSIVREHGGKI